jgi:hypothetical protein
MGNVTKGEVTLVAADGPNAGTYTMVLDFNALCDLEEVIPNIMGGQFEMKSLKDVRRIFQAALSEHHSDLDEKAVGRIVQSVGLDVATDKLTEAMKAAFPEAKGKKANPPKGPAKAGAGSAH